MVVIESGGQSYYIDDRLNRDLDKVRERVNTEDEDYFWAIEIGRASCRERV